MRTRNIFKGLGHTVMLISNKDGMPLKSSHPKKPEGMSGRQWKKLRKDKRKANSDRSAASVN